ncbi:helix-turn-helix transcriptional regulator [Comamonas sp. NyZ500]|nr:helix-turn-helix transcriptional regulator [Comamonas sp. NyZ500]
MSVAQLMGEVDTSKSEHSPTALTERLGIQLYHAPDAVIVPILSNGGSMGPGNDVLDTDVIVGDMALSPHWINQYIKPQNPMELRFIHAHGDSMNPTFTDGDVLLVDTGSGARDPSSREGVYVLQVDGKNYIKRVTPLLSGRLQVTSDNPSSKAVEILNGDHEIQVLGRVVWAWNGKKL